MEDKDKNDLKIPIFGCVVFIFINMLALPIQQTFDPGKIYPSHQLSFVIKFVMITANQQIKNRFHTVLETKNLQG